MSLQVQTRAVSNQPITDDFFRDLEQGDVKTAALTGTRWIRTKVRQESIAREIFDGSEEITREDLDRDVYTDQPKRIEEKELDSIATFVPFHGTGRQVFFFGDRFEIYFGKIVSQRNVKNKFNLWTYRSDVRKMLSDNATYDMADEEDRFFFNEVNRLLALPAAAGQVLPLSGGLTSNNVVAGLKNLISRKLPIGCMVMSQELYMEALNLPATSVGDIVASQHYEKGLEGETSL